MMREIWIAGFVMLFAVVALAEIPVIDNPLVPPAERTVEMEEVWRIGDNEGEEFIFGVIGGVLSDEAGNFYLLDTQLSEVFKFSSGGQYQKSITQKGEGPGEISLCYFCGLWDQDIMACLNISPEAVVRFDLEGTPLSQLKATPLPDLGSEETISVYSFSRRDGFIVGYGQHFFFAEGEMSQISFLSTFDDDMDEIFRYGQQPTGYNFRKPITVNEEKDFIAHTRWALGLGGEVYLVPDRTGFLIEVRDPQGTVLRKIQREWPLEKRSKEEKQEAKNGYQFSTNGMDIPDISYRISDYPPSIQNLNWVDDQLWVATSRTIKKSKETQTYVVDVFNQEGTLLEERTYRIPFDREKDEVHWLGKGRAIVVKNIHSAMIAAQGSELKVQVGEGSQKIPEEEDSILEVVLYQIKN